MLGTGGLFVGWGIQPYFSEFSASGKLTFNAEFPAGVNPYRAYRLPGTQPPSRPTTSKRTRLASPPR